MELGFARACSECLDAPGGTFVRCFRLIDRLEYHSLCFIFVLILRYVQCTECASVGRSSFRHSALKGYIQRYRVSIKLSTDAINALIKPLCVTVCRHPVLDRCRRNSKTRQSIRW